MTDTKFNEVVDKLKEIHEKYPDLRFGEVIQTAVDRSKQTKNVQLHDVPSKLFLKALENFDSRTESVRKVKKIKDKFQKNKFQKVR